MEELPQDSRAEPDLSVHPLEASRVPDFEAVHAQGPGGGWCQCVAWWVPTWEGWGDRSAAENRSLRRELSARGEYDGYLLYLGGEPIGWMQVGEVGRLGKLWNRYRLDELEATPRDLAISCVFLCPGDRGRGQLHRFLSLVVQHLEELGRDGSSRARQILAFPRRGVGLPSDDVWTGPESVFARAGFRQVRGHETHPVMARTLPSPTSRRNRRRSTGNAKHAVVVFDLGGVLVDNAGIERLLDWAPDLGPEELWTRWLSSAAVRDFESGRTSPATFARQLAEEFSLRATPEAIEEEMRAWIRGFYPGTERLLGSLRSQVRLACLSNTNELHWDRIQEEIDLYEALDHRFLSFRNGLLKPDEAVFIHLLTALEPYTGGRPEQILFLDDHPRNVAAARRHGIDARRTAGIAEVRDVLQEAGFVLTLESPTPPPEPERKSPERRSDDS